MASPFTDLTRCFSMIKNRIKKETVYTQFCAHLRQQHLLRQLPKNKHFLLDFSTNDYLGLSQHPRLIQAALTAAQHEGIGNQASRLIMTRQAPFRALESAIAKAKKTQAALLFSSGFQANIAVLSALLDPRILGVPPLVFSDKLNHASMHAGCQLAGAKQIRFRHLDYDHLAWWLAKTKTRSQPRFILTESVFGMDGDVADLDRLITLSKQYKAFLYVDEAHATGLFGSQGYGLTSDFSPDIDITMGTFSKALGSSGAYISCSHSLKRYFLNRCGGLIYSTAPSPVQIATMQAAWDVIPDLQPQAKKLQKTAMKIRKKMQQIGLNIGNTTTHIIPIILHDSHLVLKAQKYLAEHQINVSAIRPPSVPSQQSRLRIALSTLHIPSNIEKLLEIMESLPTSCHCSPCFSA